LRVTLLESERATTAKVVEQLMGNKPEERFRFISERAEFVPEAELDV
jgi:topoisomerase-4 subunit B